MRADGPVVANAKEAVDVQVEDRRKQEAWWQLGKEIRIPFCIPISAGASRLMIARSRDCYPSPS